MNVIFTCGGTAGHINPAISVAKLLKARRPDAEILFV
ncbi:MAG: glycosyltransferase, partial [Oscillospiraceae bacterium]|nr:glycosyltransferase [Oscillospiraceae bacterium]